MIGAAAAAAWLADPALADIAASLPEGFAIPSCTLSPDGRLGVLVPDGDRYQENNGNRLVDTATGKEVALILAGTGMEHMNHGGIYPQWAEDGSGLLWLVGGKWVPRAMVYLLIADGKVKWQQDLLTLSQQEILKQVRKADPVAYAAAMEENKRPGTAYPDGFTIDVKVVGREDGLPLRFLVALTADPLHLNCPLGGKTLSGRIYEPLPSERKPFDVMPMGEVVEARMHGILAADGSITWSGFRVGTGVKAAKRHQYLTGGEWRGDLPEDLATKVSKAVPEAMAAVQAYVRQHPEERCWSIVLMAEPRAPDSLAVDFLMVIDSNSPNPQGSGVPGRRERVDFPLAAEIAGSLTGSLEEDGSMTWGKFNMVTGAEALRRRVAMKQDDAFQTEARAEIRRRVEAAAAETMAALRTFATTQPVQDDVCRAEFETRHLSERHPGVRPYGFALTLEPAYVNSRQVRMPLEAEFQARLEGVVQTEGTLVWADFALLRGENARKARNDSHVARYHAGWPSFLAPYTIYRAATR